MARMTQEERERFVEDTEKKFTERLERIAADPAEWRTWVEEVANFGARYSVINQFLLLEQCEARDVEPRYFMPYGGKDGRTGWLGAKRQVRKGESGFLIWAPVKRRPTDEQAADMEAKGRKVRRDPDGRSSIQVVGFRLSSTFELSQTDPAEGFEDVEFVVPSVLRTRRERVYGGTDPELLTGEDPTGVYEDAVKLIEAEGYEFLLKSRTEPTIPKGRPLHTANGRTVKGLDLARVIVAEDLEPAARIKTTLHELAHIRCEHLDMTRMDVDLHRGRKETEAESVAHIVCQALGLDTRVYTDAYVLTWANGDLDMVKEAMTTVVRVAKQILADLTPEVGEDSKSEDKITMLEEVAA